MSEEKMREAFEKWRKSDERKNWDTIDSSFAATEQFYFDAGYKAADELEAALQESEAGAVYECPKCGAEMEISMTATPSSGYFLIAPQSAQAIETAAIIKCAEVVRNTYAKSTQSPDESGTLMDAALAVEALIPQDGRTQLAEFGMKVAQEVFNECQKPGRPWEKLRAIVTNLIGAAK